MEEIPDERDSFFEEAFDRLGYAIDIESQRQRITVHPFLTICSARLASWNWVGILRNRSASAWKATENQAKFKFAQDVSIKDAVDRLDRAFILVSSA